jgi:hypothetical protein
MIKIYPAKEITACADCPHFLFEEPLKGCTAIQDTFHFDFNHDKKINPLCPLETKEEL